MEPTLITLKRKNILNVIEYCLDNKIEFTVKDKAFGNEEFDLKLSISDIKTALSFGYYARENRIEIPGVSENPKGSKSKTQARTNAANNLMTNKGQENTKQEENDTEEEEEINETETETKNVAENTSEDTSENTSEDTDANPATDEVFEEIPTDTNSNSGLFGK